MSGETNLDRLIGSMHPVLHGEAYVFTTTSDPRVVRDARAKMTFREAEGVTLILAEDEAERLGLAGEFPCRMITLNVHSSLDAVGFIAKIATRLAAEGMGVNPVSAFYHDHLFVPADRAEDAMRVLHAMAGTSAAE
jgi:hypothetical protein